MSMSGRDDRHQIAIPLISAQGIGRDFEGPGGRLTVLNSIDLDIQARQALVIVGASGSGKSTLLHILGCLDKPSRGRLLIQGEDTDYLNDRQLAELRNRSLGFVFQFHHLLPEFTAQENVAIPLMIAGVPADQALERSAKFLEMVGLSHRAEHKPTELSGGEQQRVAIARALVNSPKVLLADEPTGNLDPQIGRAVADLLWSLHQEAGISLVVVTHNRELANRADRILELREGRLWSN